MAISSTELLALSELDLSPEQMSGVLRLLAAREKVDEERRAAQAERKRRERAKKKETSDKDGLSRDSHVTVTVTPPPLVPPLEVSPTPPSKTPPIIPPSQPGATDAFEAADAALRKIPGIADHPVAVDPVIAPIWKLLQDGFDLRTEIIPSIKRQVSKRGTARISRWSFFVSGIIEDRARANPSAPAVDVGEWQKRLEWARANAKWSYSAWGPAPHKPGCRVPAAVLRPDDGNGWGEWRAAS